jgi:hypothetical protein
MICRKRDDAVPRAFAGHDDVSTGRGFVKGLAAQLLVIKAEAVENHTPVD